MADLPNDGDDLALTPEYRLVDALTDRLERALEEACSVAVFDRLETVAALCDEAAVIARRWPAQVPKARPWS